jgi:hypothetical protein
LLWGDTTVCCLKPKFQKKTESRVVSDVEISSYKRSTNE